MSCINCGTGKTSGCENNGYCSSEGCNKLNVFDWLSNMETPYANRFDIIEGRFKNGRKGFFRNTKDLEIVTGDPVVVDVPNGHNVGYVSLQGELVRLQMAKKRVKNDNDIRGIYRIASRQDLNKWHESRDRENSVFYRSKGIIQEMKLEMKLTDVEFQADGTKAVFYYSARGRVDFRELIKLLAWEFRIRIEMRQISVRREAGRIGGLGVCGRELCCSTWLTDFKNVSTSAARYQNLSLNPSKLSGQCGRLKCCLNYELDTYTEALKDIPEVGDSMLTQKGKATLQKTDIFRKIMWFSYDEGHNWHSVSTDWVSRILQMNAKGKRPFSLGKDKSTVKEALTSTINRDLDAMDRKFNAKSKKQKKHDRQSSVKIKKKDSKFKK